MGTQTQQLRDSLTEVLSRVNLASMSIEALAEMMREYTTSKKMSHEVLDHIDCGMWLCGELSIHQRQLIDQVDVSLRQGRFVGGPESFSEGRKTLADSLTESVTTDWPEDA